MKFKLILLALIIFTLNAFSQSKNQLAIIYGTNVTSVNIHGVMGDYGYNSKTGTVYGFGYTRKLIAGLSLETGLVFADDKTQESSIVPGSGHALNDGEVKMISVPVYLKLTFLRFLYVDGGFTLDKQTNLNSAGAIIDQSGLGTGFGVGGQVKLGPVSVFVNPYFSTFAITRTRDNLIETGFKFGAGYNF